MGVRRAIDANIVGRWNSVCAAQVLGEAFGSLEPGRRRTGPEYRDVRGTERVRNAGNQRRFGPDNDQIDSLASGECDDCFRIARIDDNAICPALNARISRRCNELAAARRLPKTPGERILATARAQKQNIHGSP